MTAPDYPTPGARLLTDAECAVEVGVSRITIRRWRSRGWLEPFCRDGRRCLTHTDDLFRCERERRASATVPLERLSAEPLDNQGVEHLPC